MFHIRINISKFKSKNYVTYNIQNNNKITINLFWITIFFNDIYKYQNALLIYNIAWNYRPSKWNLTLCSAMVTE